MPTSRYTTPTACCFLTQPARLITHFLLSYTIGSTEFCIVCPLPGPLSPPSVSNVIVSLLSSLFLPFPHLSRAISAYYSPSPIRLPYHKPSLQTPSPLQSRPPAIFIPLSKPQPPSPTFNCSPQPLSYCPGPKHPPPVMAGNF